MKIEKRVQSIAVLIPSFFVLVILFSLPCDFNFAKCLGGNSIPFTRTLFHISLSLLIVSPFLFLLRETAFFSWLRLTIFWFLGTIIGIALAPEYWGGWMSFGPTKELVSIWSGILFIFTSLLFIIWKRRT